MNDRINFARGVPSESAFPRAQIADCVAALTERPDAIAYQYGPAIGPLRLRNWLAKHNSVQVENVMVGDGSIALFDILCRIWVKPGHAVLVDEPCYDRVLHLLRHYGAEIISIPLGADGPDMERVAAAMEKRPLFYYAVPDFQNPAGTTWSTDKRKTLVELARLNGFTVVEDSPYRLLRYVGQQESSFLEMAPDVTVQLSSFSKVIAPGLRAAYMVADAETIRAAATMAENTYVTPGNFALSVTAEWLERGYLPGQIAALQTLYGPRLKSMLAALDEFMPAHHFARPEGGFFIGVTLSRAIDAARLRQDATAAGIDLADGSGFFRDTQPTPFLRLPFGSMTEETARRGIRTLGEIIDKSAL